jgi:membrane-associated phospholipid phosphatase
LIEFRPGVLAEALAQRNNILGYFQGIFSFSRSSHRKTYDLCCVALQIGQFQATWYKHWAVYDLGGSGTFKPRMRPRPSQLSPVLLPPIEVPGHPAYPSGHATEAYLLAACLGEVMPTAASQPAPSPSAPGVLPPLLAMAQRIARNREVLGLHYPSDSAAGKIIATETFALLRTCKTVVDLIAAAKNEW